MSTRPDSNATSIDRPSNVLLLAPSVGDGEARACGELCDASHHEGSHAVLVSCLQSPTQRLDAWDRHVAEPTAETTVVDVRASARSAAAAAAGDDARDRTGVSPAATVESVPEGDLLELGRTIESVVDRSDAETIVCVDSLTDLLQSADEKAVFNFLEVLTTSVDRTDGVAHYHMNPDVHDATSVGTFEVLFDTVIDLRDGASVDA